ncbi:hypothetical protein F4604DRAFT_1733992 [Suillus subluteus]|nr:hypothetical protein F4604DRAFT_1733992 [Suillus subluteus]
MSSTRVRSTKGQTQGDVSWDRRSCSKHAFSSSASDIRVSFSFPPHSGLMDRMKGLRLVQAQRIFRYEHITQSGGYNEIDVQACKERGNIRSQSEPTVANVTMVRADLPGRISYRKISTVLAIVHSFRYFYCTAVVVGLGALRHVLDSIGSISFSRQKSD